MKKHFKTFIVLSLIALLTACGSSESVSEETAEEASSVEETVSTPIDTPADDSEEITESITPEELAQSSTGDFVTDVTIAIADSINTKTESIDNVSLENGDLRIYVTLGDPSPFTYEDMMIDRTSSITDEILFLEEYFDQWETITVDFGELGYIQNDHNNLQDDGYGAYFRQENFVITTEN